ncbi:MAG: penicillin-binding protein 1C [Myxococcales bacterium]|nr:penicillin-binding protein 1C [Myxococcales bacterium]
MSPGWSRPLERGCLAAGLACLAMFVAGAAFVFWPLPPGLTDYRAVASVRILDREGGLLRELLSRADGRSTPLAPAEIPSQVRAAFIAAEDKGFFSHRGVAPLSILRAGWQNLRAGRVVAGGSTLTQQLARNLVPRPRTFGGKAQEALWALRLEVHLSKEEILTQYLNRVSFGNGAQGLEAASQLYFGRRTRYLSVGQAAALAAIPRGPTAYNPLRAPDRLSERRAWVLRRMSELGLLAEAEARRAEREPLDLQAFETGFRAPHLVEWVARKMESWGLSEAAVVETSIDPELQRAVEDRITQELSRLEERRVGSAAVLVVDNATGEVLAYVGSADFFDESIGGQNDGVQMRRQPGSALKPFLYAEAFASGYTPATVLSDLEATFGGRKGVYAPKNYDRRAHGPVRAREALASSFNVPAVRLADELSPERVLDVLHRAGFESLGKGSEHYGLGLVLGNGEVSLWEAARAYSGLSRGGLLKPLKVVRRAWRPDESELPLPEEFSWRRFAEPRAVALVTDVLSDNSARARAFGLENALRLPFAAAAKTGTSKGYSDNWTIGYSRERTVAVWAGNFDGTPMVQVSGVTGAGPIFKRVLTRAMQGFRPAPLVDGRGLERESICPLSGELVGPHCPSAMNEWFLQGTAPTHRCAVHGELSASLPAGLAERCRKLSGAARRVVDLGADYHDWARREGLAEEPWLSAACAGRQEAGVGPSVLSPAPGEEYLLITDLPIEDQAIPLRISAPPSAGNLEVRIDGERVAVLGPPYAGRFQPNRGEHHLTVHREGAEGEIAEVRFSVR